MKDYTYNDMMRMQNEAKQRVLEMQKRSRSAADSFRNTGVSHGEKGESELPRIPKAISYPAELKSSAKNHSPGNTGELSLRQKNLRSNIYNIFGNLDNEDYERMFLLALCLLLAEDSHDDSLVFALMYLLT